MGLEDVCSVCLLFLLTYILLVGHLEILLIHVMKISVCWIKITYNPVQSTLLLLPVLSSVILFLFFLLSYVISTIQILTTLFIYKPNHSCRILTPSISILYRWKTSLLFSFILKLSIHQQLYHHASSTGQLLSIHYTILI